MNIHWFPGQFIAETGQNSVDFECFLPKIACFEC